MVVPGADRLRHFASTRDGHQIAIAIAVGCLLRLVWGIWALRNTPEWWTINGDQYSYWFFGNEIAHGRGVHEFDSSRATSYYPIGYPALLGVVYWLGMHTPLPDNQAQLTVGLHVVVSTLSILLVYFIGRKTFGHRVGLVAGWIVALFPSLVIGVATYSIETTFIFAALVAVAVAVDHDWSAGPMSLRRLLWFGVALGCAVVVRPFAAPVLIGVAVAALITLGWRCAARQVGWTLLTFALVLTPWTIRNYNTFDRFIPISTNLGDGLCMSRYPDSNGGFAWATHEYCADKNLPEEERNPANTRAAIRFVLDHPGEELRQWPKRFHLMMANDHGTLAEALGNGSHLDLPQRLRQGIDFASDWYYHIVWILTVAGAGLLLRGWRRDRRRGPRRAIVAITTVGLLVGPLALWGNPRFHTPMLPFMAIVAAAAVVWACERAGLVMPAAPTEATSSVEADLAGDPAGGDAEVDSREATPVA